jgi:metallo-beta-lactamase class B
METLSRFTYPGVLFLLTLAFGFWLSRVGRPYHGILFNVHKLIALGAVVTAVIQFTKMPGLIDAPILITGLLVVVGLCVVALFASGALMSAGKMDYALMQAVHRVMPVALALTLGVTLFFMTGVGQPSVSDPAERPAPFLSEYYELDEELSVRSVQPGVYIVAHSFPWPANAMLVEMDNSTLVLVDTPYTPEATKDLLAWAETQFGAREIIAINTGFHYDNLGGNAYLLERGIPVYGSDLTARLLGERGDAMRALTLSWLKLPQDQRYYEAHRDLPYAAPDHLFALGDGLRLQFGAESLEVYFPGPTHSPDNVVVYFPGRKILFAGCMAFGTDKVGNTSDADLAAWPESIRRLYQFDFEMVVPGHGDRLDKELLEHTLYLLAEYTQ